MKKYYLKFIRSLNKVYINYKSFTSKKKINQFSANFSVYPSLSQDLWFFLWDLCILLFVFLCLTPWPSFPRYQNKHRYVIGSVNSQRPHLFVGESVGQLVGGYLVRRSVGCSVSHSFLKGRKVTLPCSYWSIFYQVFHGFMPARRVGKVPTYLHIYPISHKKVHIYN